MAAGTGITRAPRAAFVSDSCVIAAALTCIILVAPLAPVLAMAIAWIAHRRPVDGRALLSGLIGAVVSGLGVALVFFAVVLADEAIGPIGGQEYLLPIVVAGLFALAFVGVAAVVVVAAVRDLSPARRANVRLDVVRLVSAGVVAVAVLVIVVVQTVNPASGFFELALFALLAALAGAIGAYGADVAYGHLGRPRAPGGKDAVLHEEMP